MPNIGALGQLWPNLPLTRAVVLKLWGAPSRGGARVVQGGRGPSAEKEKIKTLNGVNFVVEKERSLSVCPMP